MTENFEVWKPINGLAKKYYLDSIVQNTNNLKIILSDKDNKIELLFDLFESFQRTDETLRYSTILTLDKNYGADFYGDWTLFKVNNSNYIKWLIEQSEDYSLKNHIHFCFIASDSMIDVIAINDPKIKFMT